MKDLWDAFWSWREEKINRKQKKEVEAEAKIQKLTNLLRNGRRESREMHENFSRIQIEYQENIERREIEKWKIQEMKKRIKNPKSIWIRNRAFKN